MSNITANKSIYKLKGLINCIYLHRLEISFSNQISINKRCLKQTLKS